MTAPVIVSQTWSQVEADLIVARLRSEGIQAYATSNLDTTRFGTAMGGAYVFVDPDDAPAAAAVLADEPDELEGFEAEPDRRRRLAWPRLVVLGGIGATTAVVAIVALLQAL